MSQKQRKLASTPAAGSQLIQRPARRGFNTQHHQRYPDVIYASQYVMLRSIVNKAALIYTCAGHLQLLGRGGGDRPKVCVTPVQLNAATERSRGLQLTWDRAVPGRPSQGVYNQHMQYQ